MEKIFIVNCKQTFKDYNYSKEKCLVINLKGRSLLIWRLGVEQKSSCQMTGGENILIVIVVFLALLSRGQSSALMFYLRNSIITTV